VLMTSRSPSGRDPSPSVPHLDLLAVREVSDLAWPSGVIIRRVLMSRCTIPLLVRVGQRLAICSPYWHRRWRAKPPARDHSRRVFPSSAPSRKHLPVISPTS